MTSKQKSKGNALERAVRDSFNKHYNCEEFARTPSSGAIMGLSNAQKNAGLSKATQQTLGADIICPEWFPFSIECKNYADDPNYAKIIRENDKKLDGWLGETLHDAIVLNLFPLLVFKTNRKGTYAAIPKDMGLPEDIPFILNYDGFYVMDFDLFVSISNYYCTPEMCEKAVTFMEEFKQTRECQDRLNTMAKTKKVDISHLFDEA